MRGAALLSLAVAVALLAVATGRPTAGSAPGPAASPVRAVVLLHHPLDHVDPFGVAYGGGGRDTFSARYQHLVAAQGPFPFPTFVADGVVPILSLPDPDVPYEATLANYTAAVESRLQAGAPATLRLASSLAASAISVNVTVQPAGPLADPTGTGRLHLWLAVTEDSISYQPPAPVSNGVTQHRFTVRALSDAGEVDLSRGETVVRTATFATDGAWQGDRLAVAAWLQAEGAFARFAPREVVQAAAAPVGATVEQAGKAVLVEAYSATWCTPCLYSDLALEQLAIRYAGAEPLAAPSTSYFEAPQPAWLAVAAAIAGAAALAAWPRRPPP